MKDEMESEFSCAVRGYQSEVTPKYKSLYAEVQKTPCFKLNSSIL